MSKNNNKNSAMEKEKEELKECNEKLKENEEELKECVEEKKDLEKELEEYRKKSEEYYDQLLRLKAEFENYRKRVEKEKADLIEWAKYDMMLGLLPVYDMLKVAKTHISDNSNNIDNLKTGVEMVLNEFDRFFKSIGLGEIDILNKQYDPMTCEIVGVVEGEDEDDGKVVEIVQPGYIFNSKVIKPAKVKIIKKKNVNQSGGDESKQEEAQDKSQN
mgnify:CR=1 FL=1